MIFHLYRVINLNQKRILHQHIKKYIHNVLTRKVSHDPAFGVYRDDTDGSFNIGWSSFKYKNKHLFVDGKRYKATQVLWELLTETRPDKNVITHQYRQEYRQIMVQSNVHRVNYSLSSKIKANKGLKYTRATFRNSLKTQRTCLGNR